MLHKADILLIDDTPDPNLVQQLRSLPGVRVLRAATPDAVRRLMDDPAYSFRVVLLASTFPVPAQDVAMRTLQPLLENGSLTGVVVGERPAAEVQDHFDQLGFKLALWQPFDERTLRFQMNRAFLRGRRMGSPRSDLRVPVECRARVAGGARVKDALVYSLSPNGAFLQTASPSAIGARVEVTLLLPQRTLSLPAKVMHTNVPGNLQRLTSPVGMGVRFEDAGLHIREELERLIRSRQAALSL